MENRAHDIVLEYIWKHLDKSDDIPPTIEVYTVWKCKALQNWKFLISSSLLDGMYYELTFNGDKGEWYLDAYKKFENQVIREDTADTPQTDLLVTEYPQNGEVNLIGRDKTEAVVMAYDVYKELTERQTEGASDDIKK